MLARGEEHLPGRCDRLVDEGERPPKRFVRVGLLTSIRPTLWWGNVV